MIRFLLVLLFSLQVRAEGILFVGNSLTGVNNMPGVFMGLAQSQGQAPHVSESLRFGGTLAEQLSDVNVRAFVAATRWDVVILQEYSDLPLRDLPQFTSSVLEFKKLVPGARVLLFQNWPYSDADSSVLPRLDLAYEKVSRASGAQVIHLGRAMDHMRRRTEIGMYSDEKHPQPIATYMGAVMFLDAVYGISPTTFPARSSETNTEVISVGPSQLPVWINLDLVDAQIAQETARRFK